MAKLIVRNMKKSFGGTRVIDGISFEVNEGEFCILLGPSGCGKSTVLRMIAGLEQQDEGEIFIGDSEVSNLSPKERDTAMVFQSYALYPHMNVYENMAFSLRMRKRPKLEIDKQVNETARLLGLENMLTRKPKELSGGQRQRVAIGRAIVRDPKLFLFDEPLSNLDAKLRSSMRVELAKLHHKLRATTVYVTHDQVEAMTLGEKIVLLDRGVIQQIGSPDEVYNNPANLFVASFIGTPQINLIKGRIAVENGSAIFRSGGIAVDRGDDESLKKYEGKDVTMGVRPESLAPGKGAAKGQLELVEHLGPETLLYVTIDGNRIVAKAPPDFQGAVGSDISLDISKRGVYFFSGGERIAG